GLVLLAPPLAQFALRFGPADYFSLMVLGLSILVYLAHGSMARALLMAALGVVLGLVGLDSISARPRLTFDRLELVDGLGLVPIVMGLFGVGEVLFNLERSLRRDPGPVRVHGLWPSGRDWAESRGPIARGSVLGFLLGLLPGGGAVIASFLAYALEKRLSRHPERFGRGALAGVAAPESANNAATGGAFVPLMTLGVPPNVVMALLLGALMVHGVQPGPLLMSQNPGLFWGVVASMAIGNLMLLALNLPLIGLWVQVLRVPYPVLFPLILLLCLVGAYSVGHTVFDIHVMIVFGVLGYLARKLDYEPAPLVLAFVLGPMLENNLRKALILSQGNFAPFVTRPISAVCLGLALLVLASPLLAGLRRRPPPAEAGP
ncbi:MAG TPA: tripartite tricarboxylate transporter permease, partial [Candidatus Binatia bacterium]|nr:tripartite tricarboxylate transporter permease [Candidatus Binatia bacterium]